MKKLLIILSVSLMAVIFAACEQSEGAKFGILQKVSHKKFPCEYYEIQVAYQGGVAQTSSDGKSSSYSNSQDIKISKEAADTLGQYIGDGVIFEYSDDGVSFCGTSKVLTSIRIKK